MVQHDRFEPISSSENGRLLASERGRRRSPSPRLNNRPERPPTDWILPSIILDAMFAEARGLVGSSIFYLSPPPSMWVVQQQQAIFIRTETETSPGRLRRSWGPKPSRLWKALTTSLLTEIFDQLRRMS